MHCSFVEVGVAKAFAMIDADRFFCRLDLVLNTGQIVTFVIGSLIALLFYLRKYDLWFVIAVHGFFNTFALTCIYFGLA